MLTGGLVALKAASKVGWAQAKKITPNRKDVDIEPEKPVVTKTTEEASVAVEKMEKIEDVVENIDKIDPKAVSPELKAEKAHIMATISLAKTFGKSSEKFLDVLKKLASDMENAGLNVNILEAYPFLKNNLTMREYFKET